MNQNTIYIGNAKFKHSNEDIHGEVVTLDGKPYYQISNYDLIPPFFMSIVSDSDLWMFLSSNGALSAGRKNPDNAIFPYYTDDRIHDSSEITGSKTIVFIHTSDKTFLWEPFSHKYEGLYSLERNLYKNILGNHILFEEINHDLNVTFQYSWYNCDEFGFVKRSRIINNSSEEITINMCDGIQNILPSGVDRKFQLEYSTLIDGYKKNELIPDSNLGLFMLSSIPVDRAEPSESLTATTVWSFGLQDPTILLSSEQLDTFRKTMKVNPENNIRARRGAYFIHTEFVLNQHQTREWNFVTDINKNQSQVALLSHKIINDKDLNFKLQQSIQESYKNLFKKIAKADGIQLTRDTLNNFRHCSNTLFNIMRGGIFDDNYMISKEDFLGYIYQANKPKQSQFNSLLEHLPDYFHISEIKKIDHPDLERLYFEYLPLSFSRRHGDPSRPWNNFSIELKDEQGVKTLNYQGNWRDIFQNWEALAISFPEYIEGMITKFLNASTADGYNPYRVVRDGFDWEVLNPDDAWTYIGYWGDHQIIYLLKLLEISHKYHPGRLLSLLEKNIYSYANVPYKIKPYSEIQKDHHITVDFDFDLNKLLLDRVEKIGTDGKFHHDPNGELYHVSMLEKLLIPMLVKFSNFIPEAGIWMNTQRPEWNDANNALVGNGTSMVTLYYLRRYTTFLQDLLKEVNISEISISDEVIKLFQHIFEGLHNTHSYLSKPLSDQDRKKITDILSTAGSNHRARIYSDGFSGKKSPLPIQSLLSFLEIGMEHIDHSIQINEREDHLYNAYNLIQFDSNNGIKIRHLYEMLEGQVSVLSSRYLDTKKALDLLKVLRSSSIYREDQQSYILYPNRRLPHFTEKNIIPNELANTSTVLKQLIQEQSTDIIEVDIEGNIHFNNQFSNSRLLKDKLVELNRFSQEDILDVLNIYEKIFDHQSFTGRSGTFFKYEGLGSIYWHMVSKLLLAVNEIYYTALSENADSETLTELKSIYYEIKNGIGVHKNPALYGAFPTDPYSHTPEHCGVQQPGMTGQVKEDYITRFGELGVTVDEGHIIFKPNLIRKSEFLIDENEFSYYNISGEKNTISLHKNNLAFTFVQTPIVYTISDNNQITITYSNNELETIGGLELNQDISTSIFQRANKIKQINVSISHTLLT